MLEFFPDDELVCKCGCGLLRLHPGFGEELVQLRQVFDRAMVLTSACRCSAHNAAIPGHSRSLHVADAPMHPGQQGALAVDVATPDGDYRGDLFALAWAMGWSIGWNARKGFLHLDRRDFIGLPQNTFDY